MVREVVYFLIVGIGCTAGIEFAGLFGGIICGTLGFAACLFIQEKFQSSRPATGFWLRYRGELVNCTAGMICIIIFAYLFGWVGLVAGMFVGSLVGRQTVEALGWGGKTLMTEIGFREAYIGVLTSAALADGSVSDKERKSIIDLGCELFAQFGYGCQSDIEPLVETYIAQPFTADEAGTLVAQLNPDSTQRIQFDLCKVLFADGEASPSEMDWLERFQAHANCPDWSILVFYSRTFANSGSGRIQALAELGLEPEASMDQVRVAYRELAKQYHPDRQDPLPAHLLELTRQKMIALNAAYECIMNNHQRRYSFKIQME